MPLGLSPTCQSTGCGGANKRLASGGCDGSKATSVATKTERFGVGHPDGTKSIDQAKIQPALSTGRRCEGSRGTRRRDGPTSVAGISCGSVGSRCGNGAGSLGSSARPWTLSKGRSAGLDEPQGSGPPRKASQATLDDRWIPMDLKTNDEPAQFHSHGNGCWTCRGQVRRGD